MTHIFKINEDVNLNESGNNNCQRMTSLEIARLTGKRHSDVLEAIRKMEKAWVKVNGRNFPLVKYTDKKGELRPCYSLTKTETLYIATKFNDEARARLVLRWEELELAERERWMAQQGKPRNVVDLRGSKGAAHRVPTLSRSRPRLAGSHGARHHPRGNEGLHALRTHIEDYVRGGGRDTQRDV